MSGRNVPESFGRRFVRALGRILIVTVVFEVVAIVVFRTRWRPGIDAVRRFNKRFLNPVMMRFAGGEHWYASVVHHEGRKSGKPYATPIWAIPVGKFFYIPLPYGTDVDWCRNIMAAGRCVVEAHGRRYEAGSPKIVSSDVASIDLPWRDQLRFSAYGVDSYVRLETVADRVGRMTA